MKATKSPSSARNDSFLCNYCTRIESRSLRVCEHFGMKCRTASKTGIARIKLEGFYTITHLARVTHVATRTLRKREARGLLPPREYYLGQDGWWAETLEAHDRKLTREYDSVRVKIMAA